MRNLYVNHTLPNSFLMIGKDHKENGMIVEDRAQDPALVDLQGRAAPPSLPPGPLRTYGTIDCGLELMSQAWGSLQQEFSIGGRPLSPPNHSQLNGRAPLNFLNKHPVDLLVADRGSATPPAAREVFHEDRWLTMVARAALENRPKVILESWPDSSISWMNSPVSKARRTAWEKLGYTSRYHLVDSLAWGGAIKQTRLLVARVELARDHLWKWERRTSPSTHRPMGNLLTPWGLLPRHVKRQPTPSGGTERPHSDRDPMPCALGAFISTPQGTRRLQSDELARGLGAPNNLLKNQPELRAPTLRHTTSVFIWESLAHTLSETSPPPSIPLGVVDMNDFVLPEEPRA